MDTTASRRVVHSVTLAAIGKYVMVMLCYLRVRTTEYQLRTDNN